MHRSSSPAVSPLSPLREPEDTRPRAGSSHSCACSQPRRSLDSRSSNSRLRRVCEEGTEYERIDPQSAAADLERHRGDTSAAGLPVPVLVPVALVIVLARRVSSALRAACCRASVSSSAHLRASAFSLPSSSSAFAPSSCVLALASLVAPASQPPSRPDVRRRGCADTWRSLASRAYSYNIAYRAHAQNRATSDANLSRLLFLLHRLLLNSRPRGICKLMPRAPQRVRDTRSVALRSDCFRFQSLVLCTCRPLLVSHSS